jgi:hypothetical protein
MSQNGLLPQPHFRPRNEVRIALLEKGSGWHVPATACQFSRFSAKYHWFVSKVRAAILGWACGSAPPRRKTLIGLSAMSPTPPGRIPGAFFAEIIRVDPNRELANRSVWRQLWSMQMSASGDDARRNSRRCRLATTQRASGRQRHAAVARHRPAASTTWSCVVSGAINRRVR